MANVVSVDVDMNEIHDSDLIESLEDRGYVVLSKNDLQAINTALKLGDKRNLIEVLDTVLLVYVSPSFEEVLEVFFPDEE